MQRVVNKSGESSNWRETLAGVPQGSTLGPLLFRLYVWFIGKVLKHCQYHMFADDLQIYLHCNPDDFDATIDKINYDLCALTKWTDEHGLVMNPKKTQVLVIGKQSVIKQMKFDEINKVCVKGVNIDFSQCTRNLGVTMCNDLSWSAHVSKIAQKVFLSLRSLYIHRPYTPIPARINLINTLIFPILDYCDVVYCDLSQECLNRLQVIQNDCIRYIYDVPKRGHVTPYYDSLKWLKIKQRHAYHILQLTHKVLYTKQPSYLYNLFTLMTSVSTRVTRSHDLYLLVPIGPKKSFISVATALWNQLPAPIMSISNHDTFKSYIYKMLLSGDIKV